MSSVLSSLLNSSLRSKTHTLNQTWTSSRNRWRPHWTNWLPVALPSLMFVVFIVKVKIFIHISWICPLQSFTEWSMPLKSNYSRIWIKYHFSQALSHVWCVYRGLLPKLPERLKLLCSIIIAIWNAPSHFHGWIGYQMIALTSSMSLKSKRNKSFFLYHWSRTKTSLHHKIAIA